MDEIIGSALPIHRPALSACLGVEQSQSEGFKQFSRDMSEVFNWRPKPSPRVQTPLQPQFGDSTNLMRELGEFVRRFELDSQAVPDPYQHLNR